MNETILYRQIPIDLFQDPFDGQWRFAVLVALKSMQCGWHTSRTDAIAQAMAAIDDCYG